jgi:hypothetical protein
MPLGGVVFAAPNAGRFDGPVAMPAAERWAFERTTGGLFGGGFGPTGGHLERWAFERTTGGVFESGYRRAVGRFERWAFSTVSYSLTMT